MDSINLEERLKRLEKEYERRSRSRYRKSRFSKSRSQSSSSRFSLDRRSGSYRQRSRSPYRERSRRSSNSRNRSRSRSYLSSVSNDLRKKERSRRSESETHDCKGDEIIELQDTDDLNAELIDCLGEAPAKSTNTFIVHEAVASRWQTILTKGLSTNLREEICKNKYDIPLNCESLKSPLLNEEVLPLLTPYSRKKDKNLAEWQDQLGKGLSALAQGLNVLLKDKNTNKDIMRALGDSANLILDVHRNISVTRKQAVSPLLNKTAKEVADNQNSDKYLFGEDFGEKLKTARTLERSSKELRVYKTDPAKSQNTNRPTSYKKPLNWRGPSQRGGAETGKANIPFSSKEGEGQTPVPKPISTEQRQTMKFPGAAALIKLSFLKRKIPEDSIPIMLHSLSASTLRQYNSVYREWWNFCSFQGKDVMDQTETRILEFLEFEYQKKHNLTYGTFNTYKSAMALLLDKDISNSPTLKRFLRGIFRLRPPRRRYNSVWNPKIVLDYLGSKYPSDVLSVKILSKKLATLLALITGHRIQTLCKIKVQDIIISPQQIQIFIPEEIKTTRPGSEQPCLHVPFFTEKPSLCVASILLHYIQKTAEHRSEQNEYLFLTNRIPYKCASRDTVSRWIKETLTAAGIDTNQFSAYSTRHASTTTAKRLGIDIETIRRTAGWSQGSQVFAKFYNCALVDDEDKTQFANAILRM